MRDLRKYARQTKTRMVAGLIVLVYFLGLGLIYIFYGSGAAITGLICLVVMIIPIMLVVLALWVIEKIVAQASKE